VTRHSEIKTTSGGWWKEDGRWMVYDERVIEKTKETQNRTFIKRTI
jgi:hypothetical protein